MEIISWNHIQSAYDKFPNIFVWVFDIVVDFWKFSMLLLYILWDDWPIFMISGSNEQLQQQLECILLKPDCHSWWISKMQSEREDTLEERYAIELCFKLGKNATETYGMLQTAFGTSCMNRASLWLFGYSLSSEAVVLRRGKRLWRRSLTRSHKRTSMGLSRSCWNGTSALQSEEITSKGTRVLCVYYQ